MWKQMIAAAAIAATLGAPGATQTILGAGAPSPAEVTLHSGWAEPDGRRIVGLRMDLAPGWKTYWRAPGAAGIPPHFDWTGSENVNQATVIFPRPVVFESYGLRTIGYKDSVILPIAVKATDPERPLRLRLSLSYGLCEEICIPAQQDFALDIMPGERPDAAEAIESALTAAPRPAAAAGIAAADCEMDPAAGAFEARIALGAAPMIAPVVVIEGEGAHFGEMTSRIETDALVATGEMRMSGEWLDRSALRYTILSQDGGYLTGACAPG